jgi:hypothetical protein
VAATPTSEEVSTATPRPQSPSTPEAAATDTPVGGTPTVTEDATMVLASSDGEEPPRGWGALPFVGVLLLVAGAIAMWASRDRRDRA